ncbi:MAG: PQQ-binding-like beta-propeller repeat protein [Candidatus Bathyarchaeia archaeon]|jgi:hypothetical protein
MHRLRVVAAVVCTIFLFSLVLIPFANADWIMFHADPSHSGAGTGNPVLTSTLLWKYTTGNWVDSCPAVVNGVVYVGSDDGSAYAFGASPTSSNTLPIMIGAVVAVVIVAAVVFLMFQKRLKTKPKSQSSFMEDTKPVLFVHSAFKTT